jgi:hypothetical protein
MNTFVRPECIRIAPEKGPTGPIAVFNGCVEAAGGRA